MLEFAHVEVAEGTGLACVRCVPAAATGPLPAASVIERIEAITRDWGPTPGPNLLLEGGEPFDHPELPAIVAACARLGAERIAIETSGVALTAPGLAPAVVDAGVTHLHLRMLAADASAGDALAGREVTAAAEAGVAAFRAAAAGARQPVIVTAVVLVCAHNIALLPATIAALAARGFDAARLVSAGPSGASTAAYVAAACDTGMVNHLWVETDGALPLPDSHRLHAVPEGRHDD
jgi:molybdenum cofactor biosynthesis enzyme MoaA